MAAQDLPSPDHAAIPGKPIYDDIPISSLENPVVCENSSILCTKDGLSHKIKSVLQDRSQELGLLHILYSVSRDSGIRSCNYDTCTKFRKTMQEMIRHYKDPNGFKTWALQLAACICSQKEEKDPEDPIKLPAELTSANGRDPSEHDQDDSTYNSELYSVLGVLSWLNGITTGRYKVVPELNTPRGPFLVPITDAIERAASFKLCPHRIWAVAGSLPGGELNLPALIPPKPMSPKTKSLNDHGNDHKDCTFNFCKMLRADFTSKPQLHVCKDGDKCTVVSFEQKMLDGPALAGEPTAWKVTHSEFERKSIIEPSQPYMAISHVWENGTGAGPSPSPGMVGVNGCLHRFFCNIAKEFQCEGIWWDAICIPLDKASRQSALDNMQICYADARITLLHDLYLRNSEWVDAERACLEIVMSSWFTRGWTALECQKSCKVKVLFRSGTSGYVIKDLDEDILAKAGEPSTPWRQIATTAIMGLRNRRIRKIDDLVISLGARSTSKLTDMARISSLLAEGNAATDAVYKKDKKLKMITTGQRILQNLLRSIEVSQGNLFHNSETMPDRYSWCPKNLLEMPLAPDYSTSLEVQLGGRVEGTWKVFQVDSVLYENYIWKEMHPLKKVAIELALSRQNRKEHLLLAENGAEEITRALLVKQVKNIEEPTPLRCQFVGAVYFHPALEKENGRDENVRIGYTKDNLIDEDVPDVEMGLGTGEDQLVRAAQYGDERKVEQALTKAKAVITQGKTGPIWQSWTISDEYKQKALHYSVWRGHKAVVKLILDDGADPGALNSLGESALHLGAERGDVEVVRWLLKSLDDHDREFLSKEGGNTVLHRAAWGCSKSVVKLLLDSGADLDIQDKEKKTPLHIAAEKGAEGIVNLLLEAGADPDIQDIEEMTALHIAAAKGHGEIIKLLIEDEASLNKMDWGRQTALDMARSAEVVKELESAGALRGYQIASD